MRPDGFRGDNVVGRIVGGWSSSGRNALSVELRTGCDGMDLIHMGIATSCSPFIRIPISSPLALPQGMDIICTYNHRRVGGSRTI